MRLLQMQAIRAGLLPQKPDCIEPKNAHPFVNVEA
jgi:hypothetical protein